MYRQCFLKNLKRTMIPMATSTSSPRLRLVIITIYSFMTLSIRLKSSGTNFWKFTVTNARYTEIFGNFLQRIPFDLTFLPEFVKFSVFSVEWFACRKFNNFRIGFSGNFPGKFPYHMSLFRNFRNFRLNGKGP